MASPSPGVPIWRTSAFAGAFGDVSIGVTEIQDGAVGATVSTFARAVRRSFSSLSFPSPRSVIPLFCCFPRPTTSSPPPTPA